MRLTLSYGALMDALDGWFTHLTYHLSCGLTVRHIQFSTRKFFCCCGTSLVSEPFPVSSLSCRAPLGIYGNHSKDKNIAIFLTKCEDTFTGDADRKQRAMSLFPAFSVWWHVFRSQGEFTKSWVHCDVRLRAPCWLQMRLTILCFCPFKGGRSTTFWFWVKHWEFWEYLAQTKMFSIIALWILLSERGGFSWKNLVTVTKQSKSPLMVLRC